MVLFTEDLPHWVLSAMKCLANCKYECKICLKPLMIKWFILYDYTLRIINEIHLSSHNWFCLF